MRIYKPRGLNVDESYACNRSAVRKCFEGTDLSVLWGSKRSFSFDTFMRRRPKIDGTVIASLSVNHRLRNPAERGILNFYIISDPQYDSTRKQIFESECLPRMKEWYTGQLQPNPRGGVDEMLVIWTGSSLQIIKIHFP